MNAIPSTSAAMQLPSSLIQHSQLNSQLSQPIQRRLPIHQPQLQQSQSQQQPLRIAQRPQQQQQHNQAQPIYATYHHRHQSQLSGGSSGGGSSTSTQITTTFPANPSAGCATTQQTRHSTQHNYHYSTTNGNGGGGGEGRKTPTAFMLHYNSVPVLNPMAHSGLNTNTQGTQSSVSMIPTGSRGVQSLLHESFVEDSGERLREKLGKMRFF